MNTYRILIVEDNAILREMTRRRLKRRGYELLLAEDGEEGLAKVWELSPDIVLLDMSLPVVDGWTVAHKLKSSEKTADIPIIALTAHAMRGDRQRALDAGCDDYVCKPIDFDLLTAKIQSFLPEGRD